MTLTAIAILAGKLLLCCVAAWAAVYLALIALVVVAFVLALIAAAVLAPIAAGVPALTAGSAPTLTASGDRGAGMIDLPPGAYERNMRRIIRAHENAGSTERALQAMHDLLAWFLCIGVTDAGPELDFLKNADWY